MRRDVEALERELDGRAHLAGGVAHRLEALEVHDEVARRPRDEDALRGVALLFT